jgi:hypothetical protein
MLGAGDRSSLSPRSLQCPSQFASLFNHVQECSPPLCVLRLGLGLLPLRRGDAALDGEGGAVGAGHAEARSVASYLDGSYRLSMANVSLAITHFAGVASCKTRWLVYIIQEHLGTEALMEPDIRLHQPHDTRSEVARGGGATYFHTLCWPSVSGTRDGSLAGWDCFIVSNTFHTHTHIAADAPRWRGLREDIRGGVGVGGLRGERLRRVRGRGHEAVLAVGRHGYGVAERFVPGRLGERAQRAVGRAEKLVARCYG